MRLSLLALSVMSAAISSPLYALSPAQETDQVVGLAEESADTSALLELDTAGEAEVALPALQISANRMNSSIAEIAGTVQSINREQIEQQSAAGVKLADILAQLVPALATSSGTVSNFGQNLRGRQVQVLIDGVPQTGSRALSRQFNSISPEMVERVEVVSGASSVYGAGATGGMINIITKRPEAGSPTEFQSHAGLTFGNQINKDAVAYEASQSMRFSEGGVSGFVGASFTSRGEQQDSNGDRIAPEPAQTDQQDTETLDLHGRLNFDLAADQTLSVAGQYFLDEQDSDYAPDYGPGLAALLNPAFTPSLEAVKGLQLPNQPKTERAAFNLQYQNADVAGQTLDVEAYYRKEKARFFPFATVFAAPAPINSSFAALQSESDIDVYGLRAAMQSELSLAERELMLSYGVDYELEKNKQYADTFDFATFQASNGLVYQPNGRQYGFGPDTDIQNLGFFLQSRYQLADRFNLQAGVRHQRIVSETDEFTPTSEALLEDFAADNGISLPAGQVDAGKVRHNEMLFNLGGVYDLSLDQQVFANFSQGFSLPDIQRVLRDVPAGFAVNSGNVEPIKVNSYELGWRNQAQNGTNLGLTGFYNTSDKVVQFRRDRTVQVADTDERIYGVEGIASFPVHSNYRVGGTVAYTRGQYEDALGDWQELNAYRVPPLKATLFADWDNQEGTGARLQVLAIKGSDRAFEDAQDAAVDANVSAAAASKIKGFAVVDALAHTKAFGGEINLGVYNLLNKDYRSVYSQEAASTYGAVSSIPAQGTTYALGYTVKY